MPLRLTDEERGRLLETNEGPAPMLDMVSAFVFRMAATAMKLGVFEALREGPLTPAEAAERLGLDPRGLDLLMQGLSRGGYLVRDGDGYANDPVAAKWLMPDLDTSMTEGFGFYDTLLVHLWGDLDQSVRTGRPPRDYFRWLEENPATLRQFQDMLSGGARAIGGKIVELAALPDTARHLVDLGGGHGLYAAAFCEHHPELRATVFDLPSALEVGKENVERAGLSGRIGFQGGDLLRDDIGSGYDAVLLASMVHCFLPEDNERLLARVRDALNPGGVVIISEQLAGERPGESTVRRAFLQMFSMNLYHLMGGQLYTPETISGWLTGNGFEEPVVQPVGETSFSLLVARRAPD
jgi:SAM-dependent methyltransferase